MSQPKFCEVRIGAGGTVIEMDGEITVKLASHFFVFSSATETVSMSDFQCAEARRSDSASISLGNMMTIHVPRGQEVTLANSKMRFSFVAGQ